MRLLKAKWAGKCSECGGGFPAGEQIAWTGQAAHVACHEKVLADLKAQDAEDSRVQAEWLAKLNAGLLVKSTATDREIIVTGAPDVKPRHLWRNMMFRNLGAGLSSNLIADATEETYRQWRARYGELPPERLRTEIGVREVRSINPGYCYIRAGWERGDTRNGKLFLWAPPR